ncbi:TPA: hypothetical protein N0F65_001015 [Lagenidium giganteum]|uniref:DUF4605 domain-containing protein n=1 Tax=Lagenidium giganteum TaxID=4803 RepID=A0AAV2YWB8_9STRA|nr:TPA: hypothetical protein N0F65_001015 [Lagenidium giganteum]
MVHIINGEIVQDDDPRVKARMQPQAGSGSAYPRRNVAGFGGAAAPQQGPPSGAPGPAGPSPVQNLARQLGLEGTITIPGFLGFPPRPVEKIHLAIAAVVGLLFGWRALALMAFFFVLSMQSAPRAPQPPPQQRPH